MKEEYIKQVSKNLHISMKAKNEIIRDLDEIFDSALENGETEQQVIDRLGAPKEFAENVSGQTEKKNYSTGNLRGIVLMAIAICIAVIAFVVYGIIQSETVPQNAIGQANAMTNIQVEGFGINIPFIILIIGIISVAFAVFQLIRTFVKIRRQS